LAFEIVEETVFETDTTPEVDRLGSSVDCPSKLGEEVPVLDTVLRLDALVERDTRAERLDDVACEIVASAVLVKVSENADVAETEPVSVIDEVADVEALRETRVERLELLVKLGEDEAFDDNEGEGDTLAEDDALEDLVSLEVTEVLRDAMRLTDAVTEIDMVTMPLELILGEVETLRLRDSFGETEGDLDDRSEAADVLEEFEDAELVPLALCLRDNEDDAVEEADAALDLDTLGERVDVIDVVGEEGTVTDKVPRLDALGEPDARAEKLDNDEDEGDLVAPLVRELVRDNDADLVPVFDFEDVTVDDSDSEIGVALPVTVIRRGVTEATDDAEGDIDVIIEKEPLADVDPLAVAETLRDATVAETVNETELEIVALLLTDSDFEVIALDV
jgi:hypothetical protein